MDNCCDSLMKYILFILNFFFFCTGVALIAIGAYIQIEMEDYLNFVGDSYFNSSVVFIVMGVIILIIGFFGCCGACTENSCMMTTFAFLLALVVITQIGLVITVYVFKGKVSEVVVEKMTDGLENYDQGEEYQGVTDTWDMVQNEYQCCGVHNYTDWEDTTFSKENGDIPDSCCTEESTGCGKKYFEEGSEDIFVEGCLHKLENAIYNNIEIVGGIVICIIFIQIILVLIACMLANNMRRRASYV